MKKNTKEKIECSWKKERRKEKRKEKKEMRKEKEKRKEKKNKEHFEETVNGITYENGRIVQLKVVCINDDSTLQLEQTACGSFGRTFWSFGHP